MAKLYFRYGAMNCGKSTHLLQVAHNYEERGMKVCVIKPSIDTKGDNSVVSRIGASRIVDILLKSNQKVIDALIEKYGSLDISCILVDEAQFLTQEQVDELYELTKLNEIPVICYGLRTDFMTRGFPGSVRLLEISDDIEEMKTICECGKKATVNVRFIYDEPVFSGSQVAIDNGEDGISYKSMCGKCYILAKRKNRF